MDRGVRIRWHLIRGKAVMISIENFRLTAENEWRLDLPDRTEVYVGGDEESAPASFLRQV